MSPSFTRAVLGLAASLAVALAIPRETSAQGPALRVDDILANESTNVLDPPGIDILLSPTSSENVSFSYATTGGTATAGASCSGGVDYVTATGTTTIFAGQSAAAIDITVCPDANLEPQETIVFTISSPVGATIQDGEGLLTILDVPPSVTIDPVTVTEGNTGTTNATFTLRLPSAPTQSLQVSLTPFPREADAGTCGIGHPDFATGSGSVTFAPGQAIQTFTVPVCGDVFDERNETFGLTATLAGVTAGQGTATIVDDDVDFSIADVTVTESDGGTVNATFTAQLAEAPTELVSLNFSTTDREARGGVCGTSGVDFASTSFGSASIQAGQTSRTILIPVCGDTIQEPNETFRVSVRTSLSNVLIGEATATIVDNDAPQAPPPPPPLPTLSIGNVSVVEPAAGGEANAVFRVSLSAPSSQTVTVAFATRAGSATEGSTCSRLRAPADYVTTSGTLTFAPRTLTQSVIVRICGDSVSESGETFSVVLSGVTNALLPQTGGAGTILEGQL